jgi:hypothetical protein
MRTVLFSATYRIAQNAREGKFLFWNSFLHLHKLSVIDFFLQRLKPDLWIGLSRKSHFFKNPVRLGYMI